LDALLISLFDPACASCGGSLTPDRKGPVCAPCWASVRSVTRPWCATCGDTLGTWRVDDVAQCPHCAQHPPAFDEARSAAVHADAMRHIIHAMKYGRHVGLARPLADLMRQTAGDWLNDAVLVPVPLHTVRLWKRGFNQAEVLTATIGAPWMRLLRRRRLGRTQAGLHAAARRRNVADAYVVRRRYRRTALPASVILVDDVMTTGATADACARVLKDAGVQTVRVLSAARAVRDPTRAA
jgi:ComF family protein